MTVSRTLTLARQILEPPHVWIKGNLARGPDNKPCLPTDTHANRFDLAGAIERAAFQLFGDPGMEFGGQAFHNADMLCLRLLRRLLHPRSIVEFNDRIVPDHAHLLLFLDRAITVAEAEERAASQPPPAEAAAAQ
jgi:hypothetical protein